MVTPATAHAIAGADSAGHESAARDDIVGNAHALPQIQLACDYARTATPVFDYRSRELPFPTGLIEQLNHSSSGAPEFHWLRLAAWCAVLFRYSQQEQFQLDVVDSSGADTASYRSLSVAMSARSTGRQLALALARALQAPAVDRPVAAVGVSFVTCAPGDTPAELVRRTCRDLPAGRELQCLYVRHAELTLTHIAYNAALFQADAIDRLAHHLHTLLKGVVTEPDRAVADLPLLSDGETERVLADWRGAPQSYPQVPLVRHIEWHAEKTPDAIAVTFRDQHVTYAQLNRQANQIAHYLLTQGVGAHVPVAVHVAGSPAALACALGIFKAGGIYVPLDPTYPPERLAVILEDTKPRVLFTQDPLPAELAGRSPTQVLMERDRAALQAQPADNLAQDPAEANPAFIIYTSGTTGKPKGVMLSYANLVHYLLVARDRYGYTAADVIPAFARFTFSITMFEVLSPLIAGARLIILERDLILDFARLTQVLRQATAMHASASLMRRWVGYLNDHQVDPAWLLRLRHVSAGGDVVSADLIESMKATFPAAEVFVIYGSSEIACMGCTYAVPRDRVVTKNYVGKPFKNVAVRLYDTHRNLVPVGVPGEIHFGGDGVALGYLNRPETTLEKFVEIDGERFYRMGDLGRFDAEGNLEFLGRNDFQIKLRGMRIELLEIDTTLRRIPGVREAVVADKLFSSGEKGLVAYVVLAPDSPPSTAEIRRILQAKLPDYMVPSAFVVLNALPVNFNQKLDRSALPMPSADDFRNLGAYTAPSTPTQARLATIWEELLQADRIGIQDNFFDAGGNSLLSIDLVVRIEKQFGKTLPLSVVLTEPTIERLAQVLESDGSGQTGVVLLRDGGPQPPVFLIHDGDGEILPYRKLAFSLPPGRPVYGITPFSRGPCPMLHTRLADVVDHYAGQIVSIQPQGPYVLGGLCIGGFIAYEIARKLRAAGQQVELVVLLDAAHVNAPVKSINAQRVARFVSTIHPTTTVRRSLPSAALKASRKIVSFGSYVVRHRLQYLANQTRLRVFRFCLDRRWPIPAISRRIPVSVVLRFAEKEYVMPAPYEGRVALLRATHKDPVFDGTPIDDTPYVDIFAEPLMGWQAQIRHLAVYDIPGGHSSMLQDPNVSDVARAISANLPA